MPSTAGPEHRCPVQLQSKNAKVLWHMAHRAGCLLGKQAFPSSYQVACIYGGSHLQQLVHNLAMTLQTGPVQGCAVQLVVEMGR